MPSVYFSKEYNIYVLTKYEDVKEALKNSTIFSSSQGNLIVESKHRFGRTLGASDNPNHDIYKNIVKEAYSKTRIDSILADFPFSFDIEKDSARFTARILNMPYDEEYISSLIQHIQKHCDKNVLHNIDNSAYDTIIQLCKDNKPQDALGVYKCFLDANGLILSLVSGPTLSGTLSTTGAIQMMIKDLAENQDQYRQLVKDKRLIPNAVNECIRFNTSTGRFSRTLTKDHMINGFQLRKGDRVALCLDAANRDESIFEKANNFDITRDTSASLGFGYGLHSCIALYLTKAFMVRYLEELTKKYESFTLENMNPDYLITAAGNFDAFSDKIIIKHLTKL